MLYWLHVCICLQLLVWNAGRSHVKKIPSAKNLGGGGSDTCNTDMRVFHFDSDSYCFKNKYIFKT